MGFKMMPGSRSHGLKTGQGMAERGLISGGPKAYPLANNDPNSKPIEPWEVDVDLGGGTIDRQTPITDVSESSSIGPVSREEQKAVVDYQGYEGDSPTSDYKPKNEMNRFGDALKEANMSEVSPEGGGKLSNSFSAKKNQIDRAGKKISVMGGANTVGGNEINFNNVFSSSKDNDYIKGLRDTPSSARLSPNPSVRSQSNDQINQITGNIGDKNYHLNRLGPENPAYHANTSSQFSINKNQNTSKIATGDIKTSDEIANKLSSQGTLDPTYKQKLKAYKKNQKTKGTIY